MADKPDVAALIGRAQAYIGPGEVVEISLPSWQRVCSLVADMADALITLDSVPIVNGGTGASSDSTDLRIIAMELATSPIFEGNFDPLTNAPKILAFLRGESADAQTLAPAPVTAEANLKYEDLKVSISGDGTWLQFKDSLGRSAAINVEELAARYKADGKNENSVIYTALMQWCQDRIPF